MGSHGVVDLMSEQPLYLSRSWCRPRCLTRPARHLLTLPSENGMTSMVLKTFTQKWLKPRPSSGFDCRIRAEFARQRQYTLGIQGSRGTSPVRKRPPPYDPPKTLGIGLREGPTRRQFLMSEVPLYLGVVKQAPAPGCLQGYLAHKEYPLRKTLR